MYNDQPVILLSGHGGSGKDTIAKWISENTGLAYVHSTSYSAVPLIFADIYAGLWDKHSTEYQKNKLLCYRQMQDYHFSTHHYLTVEACYDDRRNQRKFWADYIDCINLEDEHFTTLYRKSCQQGNRILTGIRKRREFQGIHDSGLCDLSIWIERIGIPKDITQEYGPEDCDMSIIVKEGTAEMERKLLRIKRIVEAILL